MMSRYYRNRKPGDTFLYYDKNTGDIWFGDADGNTKNMTKKKPPNVYGWLFECKVLMMRIVRFLSG